ncbi:MAG: oxygen-independent coproporphyrinogen III oxidase [Bacteroidota bacterium]
MLIPRILLERYNKPIPRYTSYPPATFFSNEFKPVDYIDVVLKSNQEDPQNISFYIHVPFCRSLCWFCGCNTQVCNDRGQYESYFSALQKEILLLRPLLAKERKVSQVHWGGGTPNSVPLSLVKETMDLIYSEYDFIENPEVAIECNPAYLDKNDVDYLFAAKFNRISLGVQDFNPSVLKAINRQPSKIPLEELVEYLKKMGMVVNLDFIYGLPLQTAEGFKETILKALEISPQRLVTFSYAHVPWTKKNQLKLEEKGIPPTEEKIKMQEIAYFLLTNGDYRAIGMDHYALEDDELSIVLKNNMLHRNFQGYCTRRTTGQVYAFGSTGISQVKKAYAQNIKNTNQYIEIVESGNFPIERGYILTSDDNICREIITQVMCNKYIDWDELSNRLSLPREEILRACRYDPVKLNELQEDGLLIFDDKKIMVTNTGHFFIRNIASIFDPWLSQEQDKYSKTL